MNLNPWRRIRELEQDKRILLGIVDERGRALAELDRRNEELQQRRRVDHAISRQVDDPPEPLPDSWVELLDDWADEDRRMGAVEDETEDRT